MKIGFVLDDGLDKPDGVQQYILTLGKWYESQGHEISYIVGQTKRTDLPNVHSMSKNVKVSFNGNRLSIPLPAKKSNIKKLLEHKKFDVLHVQVPYSPFMGAKVISLAPKNTVIFGTFHILPYGWVSWAGSKMLGHYLSHNIKKFDEIVSVSKPAAVFAKKAFGIDTTVIPNAVNLSEFTATTKKLVSNAGQKKHNSKDKPKFKIVFLGRLVERKGAHILIDALINLKNTARLMDNISVDICGDGPQKAQLQAKINQAKLNSKVKFHGFINQQEKASYLEAADLAIFPSSSGESFGIVLVEAIASGSKVVLGGDNPGYRSVLKDQRSIVEPKDPVKLADQIHNIAKNTDLQSELHQYQQKMIQEYDVSVVGAKLLRRYAHLQKRHIR